MSPNVLTGCLLYVELEESQPLHETHISELREINSNHSQCLVMSIQYSVSFQVTEVKIDPLPTCFISLPVLKFILNRSFWF